MTRQTSIEVYRQIEREGLLGRLQLMVYDVLFHRGPLTSGELWKFHFPELQRQSLTPRLIELERMGAVRSGEKRACQFSGRDCVEWDVTDGLPVKPVKTETKDEVIARLQARVAELEKEIERYKWNGGQGKFF